MRKSILNNNIKLPQEQQKLEENSQPVIDTKLLYQRIYNNEISIISLIPEEILQLSMEILQKPYESRDDLDLTILCQFTNRIKFFREILQRNNGYSIHKKCCKYLQHKQIGENQLVFKQGTEGTTFWIILSGEVKIIKTNYVFDQKHNVWNTFDSEEIRLGSGNCFGELALKNNQRRQASVYTTMNTNFGVLEKDQFLLIMQIIEKEQYEQLAFIDHFSKMKICKDLPYNKVKMLYDLSEERIVPINNFVYSEGDDPDGIYFVKFGDFVLKKKVNLFQGIQIEESNPLQKKQGQLKEISILSLPQGETFGEDELFCEEFKHSKRQYSVQCTSELGAVYFITKREIVRRALNDQQLQQLIQDQMNIKYNFRLKKIDIYQKKVGQQNMPQKQLKINNKGNNIEDNISLQQQKKPSFHNINNQSLSSSKESFLMSPRKLNIGNNLKQQPQTKDQPNCLYDVKNDNPQYLQDAANRYKEEKKKKIQGQILIRRVDKAQYYIKQFLQRNNFSEEDLKYNSIAKLKKFQCSNNQINGSQKQEADENFDRLKYLFKQNELQSKYKDFKKSQQSSCSTLAVKLQYADTSLQQSQRNLFENMKTKIRSKQHSMDKVDDNSVIGSQQQKILQDKISEFNSHSQQNTFRSILNQDIRQIHNQQSSQLNSSYFNCQLQDKRNSDALETQQLLQAYYIHSKEKHRHKKTASSTVLASIKIKDNIIHQKRSSQSSISNDQIQAKGSSDQPNPQQNLSKRNSQDYLPLKYQANNLIDAIFQNNMDKVYNVKQQVRTKQKKKDYLSQTAASLQNQYNQNNLPLIYKKNNLF